MGWQRPPRPGQADRLGTRTGRTMESDRGSARPVMVWIDEQLGEFLHYAAVHAPDPHPMWQFMAYRGFRRGEASGLLDAEVRLGKAEVSIINQDIGRPGGRRKPPKSQAGNRDVILD